MLTIYMGRILEDDTKKYHNYENIAGIITIIIRLLYLIYFFICIFNLKKVEKDN